MGKREGVMLASKTDNLQRSIDRWKTDRIIVQPKIKGVRCRAVLSPAGEVHLLSSQQNEIVSAPHINLAITNVIKKNLQSLPFISAFDGELYIPGVAEQTIIGYCGREYLNADSDMLEYYVFDLINDYTQSVQSHRLMLLWNIFPHPIEHIELVPSTYLLSKNCEAEVLSKMDEFVTAGFEGIIIRNPNALYQPKRTTDLLKIKPAYTMEVQIIGYEEEVSIEGVYKGSLGSFTVQSNSGAVFSVGTGFTRAQRVGYWLCREKYRGSLATIRYQNISEEGRPKPAVFDSFVEERS
jgi:ATP-dependent DNA ligase